MQSVLPADRWREEIGKRDTDRRAQPTAPARMWSDRVPLLSLKIHVYARQISRQKDRLRPRMIQICYFPLKISQSPCDVPMSSSMGSDNQALVREAMKA